MNSNIPAAVRKQADEAEQLAKEHGLKKDGQDDDKGKPLEAANAIPQDKPVENKPQEEDWETRFKNYKTTTDRTIGELRQSESAANDRINQLTSQVNELTEKLNSVPEAPAPTPETGFDINSLPEDMRSEYDDAFLVNMSKLNTIQMTKIVGDLRKEIDSLKGKVTTVENTQVKSASEKYYDLLDKEWEGWDIDDPNDPRSSVFEPFIKYINENPVSVVDDTPLATVFYDAHEKQDSKTVLNIRRGFLAQQLQTAGASEVSDSSGDTTLDELASPDTGNGSGNIADEIGVHTQSFKQSDVKKFYDDVTKGKYDPDEVKAIERNIIAAQEAGKLLPG